LSRVVPVFVNTDGAVRVMLRPVSVCSVQRRGDAGRTRYVRGVRWHSPCATAAVWCGGGHRSSLTSFTSRRGMGRGAVDSTSTSEAAPHPHLRKQKILAAMP
jgi:hypothetical protein